MNVGGCWGARPAGAGCGGSPPPSRGPPATREEVRANHLIWMYRLQDVCFDGHDRCMECDHDAIVFGLYDIDVKAE